MGKKIIKIIILIIIMIIIKIINIKEMLSLLFSFNAEWLKLRDVLFKAGLVCRARKVKLTSQRFKRNQIYIF